MASETVAAHPSLYALKIKLLQIYDDISNFQPPPTRPPILDSSIEIEPGEESQWIQQEDIPGLKKLKESIRVDLDLLEKFLNNTQSAHLPPLSTNAPYLIAVWNEVLCAPPPVTSVFKTFTFTPEPRKRGTPRAPGAKVDVVAENGRQWIRVNTIRNSRMLSEFREIDSYLTESLLDAAKANVTEGTNEMPRITLRLTRLDPNPPEDSDERTDPRISQTINMLHEMGITVELGERNVESLPADMTPAVQFESTIRINLDLSVLIALISDLTHAPLPTSIEEANSRFIPPQEYPSQSSSPAPEFEMGDVPIDLAKNVRALSNQLLQEMGKGMIQEIRDRICSISDVDDPFSKVEFWTTPEARDRCIQIVSKIGGPSEKRRANAIFSDYVEPKSNLTLKEMEDLFWKDSRFPTRFFPLLPIHLYPSSEVPDLSIPLSPPLHAPSCMPMFFKALGKTCKDILAQERIPHPKALPEEIIRKEDCSEIQRATVTKANPRLTAHTVLSMMWGAELGWTTLTANRTSVRAILREMKLARAAGRLEEFERKQVRNIDAAALWSSETDGPKVDAGKAAVWVVDPRSLAEGMSSHAGAAASGTETKLNWLKLAPLCIDQGRAG
ncbi:hypothetical protein BDQ17DRAFT_1396918 [Cyathus striatus]|nr:hypothetical protein BDQ17DRAFT_1396918 [Cyathus striatus]